MYFDYFFSRILLWGEYGNLQVTKRGWTYIHLVMDFSILEVRTTFDTNVFRIMAMCQTFIGQLIAAKGLIINILSFFSVLLYLFESAYCAFKPVVSTYLRYLQDIMVF